MSIHVALRHVTHYRYDRLVNLSPHVVRLRPAPHCRTPILSYSLNIEPAGHFINWQQDPFSNYLARLVFPEKTGEFKITVDLVAEMSVFNPFDFFLEPSAEQRLRARLEVIVLNRGWSGLSVYDQRGELLGIGSLFVMDAMGGNRRLPGNMFVPVDLLKPILAELQQTGTSKLSRRPWLGLTSSEQGGRVQVVRVNKDGPAQAAGLQPGDVVLAVDGTKVATLEAFYKQVWQRANPDDEIQLTVLQGAEIKTLTLKAVDRMSTMLKPAGI